MTDRYYAKIRDVIDLEKKYRFKGIPAANRPLRRVDLPFVSIEDEEIADSYAKMYGGYSNGSAKAYNKKIWVIYISKNEDIKQAKNLVGIELVRLQRWIDEDVEFLNNYNLNKEEISLDIKKLNSNIQRLTAQEHQIKDQIREIIDERDIYQNKLRKLQQDNEPILRRLEEFKAIKKKEESALKQSKEKLREFEQFKRLFKLYQYKFLIIGAFIAICTIFFLLGSLFL
ncbi:MAG: hypothetical protein ACTSRZ_18570 [Promethearchaeota archaeon]